MITQKQFEAALVKAGFGPRSATPCICGGYGDGFHTVRCAEAARLRSEPPAERRDCDEPILGVPRG